MNLGLGNLIGLKRHLLAASLVTSDEFDAVIADLGRGVAAQFDKFANRKFARAENDVCEFSADRDHFYLPRFPIETITKIEQRDSVGTGWQTLTLDDVIQNRDDKTGLLFFGARLGEWFSNIRVTYSGGFWFDATEDENDALPDGATALPDDVRLAWLLQCQHVWNKRDNLGVGISQSSEDRRPTLTNLELIPQVKEILSAYIRYQIA